MMKKFKYFLLALVAVAVGVGFAACGGDDNEPGGNGGEGGNGGNVSDYASLIVGTWTESGNEIAPGDYNTYGLRFNANGTCQEYSSGWEDATWKIVGNHLYITFPADEYYEAETESYEILKLNSTTLTLQVEGEYDDVFTLRRVKENGGGNVTPDPDEPDSYAQKIIGTWTGNGQFSGNYDDGNYGFIFKANGTCVEIGSGYSETTYRVQGNRLYIYDDYYDEYDWYYIRQLTDTKLVLGEDDYEYEETLYRVR